MISSEVQRTLVKSPPELWAELSDPAALGRHLGGLGEIRITRIEPEKLVAWEAEGTTGTVAIKASGWGTKVTLKVNRELSEAGAEPVAAHPEVAAAVELPADVDPGVPEPAVAERGLVGPVLAELDLWASQEREQAGQPMITAAERFAGDDAGPLLGTGLPAVLDDALEQVGAETDEDSGEHRPGPSTADEPDTDSKAPRRGFLARLFGRRRERSRRGDEEPESSGEASTVLAVPTSSEAPAANAAEDEPEHELSAEPAPLHVPGGSPAAAQQPSSVEPAPLHLAGGSPAAAQQPSSAEGALPGLAAELREAEQTAAEEVTALLTAVLDRLGAAHHRPFSRA